MMVTLQVTFRALAPWTESDEESLTLSAMSPLNPTLRQGVGMLIAASKGWLEIGQVRQFNPVLHRALDLAEAMFGPGQLRMYTVEEMDTASFIFDNFWRRPAIEMLEIGDEYLDEAFDRYLEDVHHGERYVGDGLG